MTDKAQILALAERVEALSTDERALLLGQISVDIEIALNKVGVLLTEAQGYIAAEAALRAIAEGEEG